MKISLCIITGNRAHEIDRFIRNFAPLCDELVIVRAIGNQTPDNTMDMARQLCADLDTPLITADYYNDPTAADRPHLDNYAYARQQSWGLATGDFLIWLDTDDIMEPEMVTALRHAVLHLPPHLDAIRFPYRIPGESALIMRERGARRGLAHWINAVHECLDPIGGAPLRACDLTDIIVTHAPGPDRRANDERNLWILQSIPESNRSMSHRFHLFGALRGTGQHPQAIHHALALLTDPDLGKAEAYEMLLQLAEMSDQPGTREGFFLRAAATDSTRREAWMELALHRLRHDRPQDALALTTMALTLDLPDISVRPWNLRENIYGWMGRDTHALALRASGHHQTAAAHEINSLVEHGPRISLLHATRGRPGPALRARKLWLNRARKPETIEHIFALDSDDDISAALALHHHVIVPGGLGCVAAWNAAASVARCPILVQMSDDWLPPYGWDDMITQRLAPSLAANKPAVLHISDGHRTDDLMCMAILTQQRLQQQGGRLFHPSFLSVFSDNYFSQNAYADNVVIDAPDIIFEHLHPIFGKAEWDTTTLESNAAWRYDQGQEVLTRLNKKTLTHGDVGGWFDYLDYYEYLAQELQDGDTHIELGCWLGKSIIYLAQRLQDQNKKVRLVVVDTFTGDPADPSYTAVLRANGGNIRAAFESNIRAAGISDMIEIMEFSTDEAASLIPDSSVASIFIDAAHDQESVHRDLTRWIPKLKGGGFLAGHDYATPSVRAAVDALLPTAQSLSNTSWILPAEQS